MERLTFFCPLSFFKIHENHTFNNSVICNFLQPNNELEIISTALGELQQSSSLKNNLLSLKNEGKSLIHNILSLVVPVLFFNQWVFFNLEENYQKSSFLVFIFFNLFVVLYQLQRNLLVRWW